jgi:small subunit ribosomal protein S6
MNKQQYESVIILTPVLSEQQMQDAVSSYRELITENGGEIVHEENWGLTKLAYPIEKKGTGFYHLFEFKANPDFIIKWELAFRRDERVLRYLTISLDKWGVQFNEKRRSGEIKASSTAKEKKAVQNALLDLDSDDSDF